MDDYTLATPDRVRFDADEWPAIDFYRRRQDIHFPDWQRNARWSDTDEEGYIETLIKHRESAEIALHVRRNYAGELVYDVLDGINRFNALKKFFGNNMSISTNNIVREPTPENHRVMYCSLTPPQREIVKHIRIRTRIYDEDTPEEHLKGVFLSRNMGKPVTSGEMIHIMTDHPMMHHLLTPMDERFSATSAKLACGSCWRTANHGMYHVWVMIAAMVVSDNRLLPYKSEHIRQWLLKQYTSAPPTQEQIDRVMSITQCTMEALLDWAMHGKIPSGKKAIADVAWVFYSYGCTRAVIGAVQGALEEIMQDEQYWTTKKENVAAQIGRREVLGGIVHRELHMPRLITDYGVQATKQGKRLMAIELINTPLSMTYAEEEELDYLRTVRVHVEEDDLPSFANIDPSTFVRICEYSTVDGKEANDLSERKRRRTEEMLE